MTAPTEILRGSLDPATLLARLAESPDRVAAAVRGASDDALGRAPAPGEWSARTVLAHLRDDEFMVMNIRAVRMLVEDNPALAPFDEQAWAATRWRGADGVDDLVEGFRQHRNATLAALARATPEQWRRTGSQPEIGSFDLLWWMEHTLEHDEDHIAQLERALATD